MSNSNEIGEVRKATKRGMKKTREMEIKEEESVMNGYKYKGVNVIKGDMNKEETNEILDKFLETIKGTSEDECEFCKVIKKMSELKYCSVCKKVLYCSVLCQKSHWKIHKQLCSKRVKIDSFLLKTHEIKGEDDCYCEKKKDNQCTRCFIISKNKNKKKMGKKEKQQSRKEGWDTVVSIFKDFMDTKAILPKNAIFRFKKQLYFSVITFMKNFFKKCSFSYIEKNLEKKIDGLDWFFVAKPIEKMYRTNLKTIKEENTSKLKYILSIGDDIKFKRGSLEYNQFRKENLKNLKYTGTFSIAKGNVEQRLKNYSKKISELEKDLKIAEDFEDVEKVLEISRKYNDTKKDSPCDCIFCQSIQSSFQINGLTFDIQDEQDHLEFMKNLYSDYELKNYSICFDFWETCLLEYMKGNKYTKSLNSNSRLWPVIKEHIVALCKFKNFVNEEYRENCKQIIMLMIMRYIKNGKRKKSKAVDLSTVEKKIRRFNPEFFLVAQKIREELIPHLVDVEEKGNSRLVYNLIIKLGKSTSRFSIELNIENLKLTGFFIVNSKDKTLIKLIKQV